MSEKIKFYGDDCENANVTCITKNGKIYLKQFNYFKDRNKILNQLCYLTQLVDGEYLLNKDILYEISLEKGEFVTFEGIDYTKFNK